MGFGGASLFAMLFFDGALAAPVVRVEAEVAPDLAHVQGVLRWEGDLSFVDALARLPDPPDDRSALRTWPRGPEHGSVTWREGEDRDGSYLAFEASLPDRYDACGRVPGQGLFASGLWLPQPVDAAGRVPVVAWDASVRLPEGTVGALGSAVGEGTLRWEGEGERLALAVVPRGRVFAAGEVTLLSARRVSRGRQRWISRAVPAGLPLVVVQAPLMRRLVRPAPGLLFLSSRAFRLTPGLRHLHLPAVARGALEAGLAEELPDPDARSLQAAIRAREVVAATPSAQGLLRWFSWLPQVDDLLYSGSTPYVAEVLQEPWPGDTVADDLLEVLDPRLPGPVRLGWAEARGLEPRAVDPAVVTSPLQDYRLQVEGARLEVERIAPADAPPEPVVVEVDGRRQVWESGAGPGEWSLDLDPPPARVRLDPDGLLRQKDRGDDSWPARWTAVVAAMPTVWSLSTGRLEGYIAARVRRQRGTHGYFDAYLSRDEVDLVGTQAAVGWAWGPLQDQRRRPCRLYAWTSGALLDPAFRPVDGGTVALEVGATLTWDTEVDWLFPLRGHVATLQVRGGTVPGSSARWAGLFGSLGGVASPHPRLVLAGEAQGGLAWGETEHRLEVLGGVDSLRSLPAALAVGHGRTVVRAEVRVAPLRHISVPLGLVWIDEVQIASGLEAGVLGGTSFDSDLGVSSPDGWLRAAGATAGVFVVADVLGGAPALAGVLLAKPVAVEPAPAGEQGGQVYLLWEQAF